MAKETITNRVITGVLIMIIGALLMFIGNYALEGFTSKIITVISAKIDKHIRYSDSCRIIKENAELEEKNKAIIKDINNEHKQDLLIKDVKKICKILNLDSYSDLQPVEIKLEQDSIFNYNWYKKHYDVAVNDSVWDYNESIRANKEIMRANKNIIITRKNGIADDASKYLKSNKQN